MITKKQFSMASIIVAVLLMVAITGHQSNVQAAQHQSVTPANEKAEQLRFVGSSQCSRCHKQEVEAWQGSHHDLAMQHADGKSVLGDFNNAKFEYNGVITTFFKKGDQYFVNTDGPDGKLQDYQILYTFGVEPLQQYLIALPGGRLQALGIAWDSRTKAQGGQRWYHLYPDEKIDHKDRLHWTKADQNWNYMCAECHSTNLKKNYIADKKGYRTTWSEINVACEACHGPASRHVDWAQKKPGWKIDQKNKGLSVNLDERTDVVWQIDTKTGNAQRNKAKTSNKEIEICARCHARRSTISTRYDHSKPFMDSYVPATLTEFLYHPDGQIKEEVYVYGSFIQSKMYHKGVTCSDCHEPHSLKLHTQGNGICLQCHAADQYNKASHHFHDEKGKGGLCAECHMPVKNYMVIDGRHDHSIRIPRPDLSVRLNTPNACNNCHTDKTSQWASQQMQSWYGKDWAPGWHYGETIHDGRNNNPGAWKDLAAVAASPKLPTIARATAAELMRNNPGPITLTVIKRLLQDDDSMVRLSALQTLDDVDAQQRFKMGFKLLTDPVRAVRIAAARIMAIVPRDRLSDQQKTILDNALKEYRQAQRANAERPESHINLGLLATSLHDFSAAEKAYNKALSIDKDFVSVYVNLADLYRSQHKEDKAEQALKQAQQIAPQDAAVQHALGLLYVRKKQLDKALQALKEAYRLQESNARYGYVYAVALNANGQTRQAIDTLEIVHSRHPTDRDVMMALITYYQSVSDRAAALKYANKLIKIDPRYGTVDQLLKRLKN